MKSEGMGQETMLLLETTQSPDCGSTGQGLRMCGNQSLTLKTACLALEGSGRWV